MSTSGSWRIYGSVTGLASGTRAVDVSITVGASGIDGTQAYTVNGFQAFTVPSGAAAVLIIPDSANAQTLTLKGVTGDTGIALSKTQPTVVALGTSPSIGITTGGSATFTIVWM